MKRIANFVIDKKSTLLIACNAIEKNKSRCVLISEKKKIIGVLSEGDVMRALIRGTSIYSKIEPFINLDFFYLTEKDLTQAKKIFRKNLITIIPILNKSMKLINIITLRDIFDVFK
jgi:predicted transcriptional regulator